VVGRTGKHERDMVNGEERIGNGEIACSKQAKRILRPLKTYFQLCVGSSPRDPIPNPAYPARGAAMRDLLRCRVTRTWIHAPGRYGRAGSSALPIGRLQNLKPRSGPGLGMKSTLLFVVGEPVDYRGIKSRLRSILFRPAFHRQVFKPCRPLD